MWNQQRLEQMIADGVEESLTLDYKASGAFAKQTQKREEIQKDVSAFANSAGGTIIYGIKEHSSHDRKHLPERIDAIPRDQFSKEWLEQIISGIQPRIQGVVIHPVQLDSSTNNCCYVVEIPQSETVHQAPDGKYYRRYNFENRFMQDYEVREAMDRTSNPVIEPQIFLDIPRIGRPSHVAVRLSNRSKRIAIHYMCEVRLPLYANKLALIPCGQFRMVGQPGGIQFTQFNLTPTEPPTALFPGASVILGRELKLKAEWALGNGTPLKSADYIVLTLFADEAEPRTISIDLKDAYKPLVS